MATALSIIVDSFERLNRLSPGETLDPETSAFGLRRLNLLVDEMSAVQQFLFQDVIVSGAQAGNITLGAGAWAAIASGNDVISAAASGVPLAPITMQQYNSIFDPTTTGTPTVYAPDGLSTIYLWPVPNGHTIRLQYRVGAGTFADYTTNYVMPAGYQAALGAGLAVRLAPSVLGKLPSELVRAEARCMDAISAYMPAIIDVGSFANSRRSGSGNPVRLF